MVVKCVGEVNRHSQRAEWGQGVVEIIVYFMCERETGGNGGVVGTEAMLGGGKRE